MEKLCKSIKQFLKNIKFLKPTSKISEGGNQRCKKRISRQCASYTATPIEYRIFNLKAYPFSKRF